MTGLRETTIMETTAVLSPEPLDVKPTTELVAKPTSALTPPVSEEMNHEQEKDSEDSELSELELDEEEEEEEEITPDHYWDGGKIPVFKPTMDQFRDFQKFIDKIDKYGMKSGIVKVIPPKEWRDSLPKLDEHVKRIKIKNPIMQEFNGTFGTYTQQNVEKQRSYNLPEWKALTEEPQHQPPAKRGERRRNQDKMMRGVGNLRSRASTVAATSAESDGSLRPRKKATRQRRSNQPSEEAESDDEGLDAKRTCANIPPTPNSPAIKPAKSKTSAKSRGTKGQAKSVTSRRLNNTAESADWIDEDAFKNFNYNLEGVEEFTPSRCAELETQYWRSLGFNQPMYAADMPGSLFDDTTTSWNVAKLPNLLDVLGTKVPGVNTAYLYMGMWKATFAWHLEDVDLYSINYIHFGAPKQWYSISQEDARKFEAAMKQVWPVDSKNCDQFLRHKTYLISPDVLQKQFNVKVNKLVHYEGEFVITYPYGYHSGYNIGYNCAESVNFATESWLEYGRIARKCNCEADNVWVDVNEIERKLRGEPTPEYYEETDDEDDELSDEDCNLPSPPASVKGKAQRSKKRKREVKDERLKKKKKIRIKIKAPTREPCAICPNDNPWEDLLPTDTGKKVHRSCAQFTPETWIEADESGAEKVYGINTIDRARLDLKCNFCRSKRGACFQCSSKKCTRAFHATCALAAGVLVDSGLVPTFGEDGTEYFEEGYDFRCKYHRPKMPKNPNIEVLENSKRINSYAKELKCNDVIQAQYLGQEVFAGLIVENRPSEMSVVVNILPDGDRVEVEWKWLCVLNPDDSQRPKPSTNALPMPKGMNKRALSISNRQDGVPEQGDAFHDNPDYKFQEFYNMHMPPPGYATKPLQAPCRLHVDINAADQLYYYMPTISTEAKDFFTERVGSNVIAPRANFVERVSPPRQEYQYLNKLPIAASRPMPRPIVPHRLAGTIENPSNRGEKPYVYKPKEPARPNVMWSIDPQALAIQKSFVAQTDRRHAHYSPQQPKPSYNYQDSDPVRNVTPLRPFPRDHYYSTETLPAAMPGEYSDFTHAVRRQSQGAQTLPKSGPEARGYIQNYQSSLHQEKELKPFATNAGIFPKSSQYSKPPKSNISGNGRPKSSAPTQQTLPGAPLTPITTISATSRIPETPPGYLENLQKYPYLRNSFLRSKRPYESPYPTGGGFTSQYLPLELDKDIQVKFDKGPPHAHTPSASVSSVTEGERRVSQQWTPPSQMWHASGFGKQQTPPPLESFQYPFSYQPQDRQYIAPTYQTADQFRQSFQSMASPASRDGAQARLLRDQMGGYGPFAPHTHAQPLRNSLGFSYDAAKMWQSPQAPSPSPLSDPNTPGTTVNQNPDYTPSGCNSTWTMLPTSQTTPALPKMTPQTASTEGCGPMLPLMHGGIESWR